VIVSTRGDRLGSSLVGKSMPTARQALEIEAMARLAKARRADLPTPEMPYVEQ
jgi:hypothetical protein